MEQSRQPEPLNAAALLTFHDAIELFLQLAAEHLNVSKSGIKFMEYWDLLNRKLPSDGLKHKEAMRRLNEARGSLKHRGNRPARDDVEEFRATARLFFEDNTPLVFNIDFANVTLADYVRDAAARNDLSEAEERFRQGRKAEALGKLAVAFARIADGYRNATGIGVARSRLPHFWTSRASYRIGGLGAKVQDPTVKKMLASSSSRSRR